MDTYINMIRDNLKDTDTKILHTSSFWCPYKIWAQKLDENKSFILFCILKNRKHYKRNISTPDIIITIILQRIIYFNPTMLIFGFLGAFFNFNG